MQRRWRATDELQLPTSAMAPWSIVYRGDLRQLRGGLGLPGLRWSNVERNKIENKHLKAKTKQPETQRNRNKTKQSQKSPQAQISYGSCMGLTIHLCTSLGTTTLTPTFLHNLLQIYTPCITTPEENLPKESAHMGG